MCKVDDEISHLATRGQVCFSAVVYFNIRTGDSVIRTLIWLQELCEWLVVYPCMTLHWTDELPRLHPAVLSSIFLWQEKFQL